VAVRDHLDDGAGPSLESNMLMFGTGGTSSSPDLRGATGEAGRSNN